MGVNSVQPDRVIEALINKADNKSSDFSDFELVNLFEFIVSENQTVYEKFELNKIENGLDELKGRIDQKKENLNPLVKLFLRITKFFGFKDKYEEAEKSIEVYKGKIGEIKTRTEAIIGGLNAEITFINARIKIKEDEIKKKEDEIAVLKASEEKERPKTLEKDKTGESVNDSNTPSKKSNKGKIFGFFRGNKKGTQEKKPSEVPIKQEPRKENVPVVHQEIVNQNRIPEAKVAKLETEVTQLKTEVAYQKKNLEDKENSLNVKKRMLGSAEKAKIISQKVFDELKQSLFTENEIKKFHDTLVDIRGRISPTLNRVNDYHHFLRKLIFGFSVGEKKEKEALVKAGFNEKELGELLEGGNSAVNYFYMALTLNNLSEKNPALSHLSADFKRSLKIALKLQNKDPNLSEVEIEIKDTINSLKPGERLFVPTGTKNHATLMVFEKLENGKNKVAHFNTGEGVATTSNGMGVTKLTYNPIDVSKVNLNKIIGPSASVEELYKNLSSAFGVGTPGETKPIQINGTCSFQVISAALEDILGKNDYPKYKKALLKHIDLEFSEATKKLASNNPLLDPKYLALHKLLTEESQR